MALFQSLDSQVRKPREECAETVPRHGAPAALPLQLPEAASGPAAGSTPPALAAPHPVRRGLHLPRRTLGP